jgi:isopentenyl-diphosphate delta-isomerase
VSDELGISLEAEMFEAAGVVTYSAHDPLTGLAEREFDHLFVARYTGEPRLDPAEVAATARVSIDDLLNGSRPGHPIAPWFETVIDAAAPTLRGLTARR